jgi:hypothetical protein
MQLRTRLPAPQARFPRRVPVARAFLLARAFLQPESPLAGCRRVGHIGLTGDVAEWLKAAVC